MVAHLASRPILTEEAEEYWAVFQRLARDRPHFEISGGMGPGIRLPERIPLAVIRAEGIRLQFDHDDLERFVGIIGDTDDLFVELRSKRIAKEVEAARREAERKAKQRR